MENVHDDESDIDVALFHHEPAVYVLIAELKAGEESVVDEDDWIPEENILKEFAG